MLNFCKLSSISFIVAAAAFILACPSVKSLKTLICMWNTLSNIFTFVDGETLGFCLGFLGILYVIMDNNPKRHGVKEKGSRQSQNVKTPPRQCSHLQETFQQVKLTRSAKLIRTKAGRLLKILHQDLQRLPPKTSELLPLNESSVQGVAEK